MASADTGTLNEDLHPAYGLSVDTLVKGPQCSKTSQFCFLCSFQTKDLEIKGDRDGEVYESLEEYIRSLAGRNELNVIVDKVFEEYDTGIRQRVEFVHPITKATVVAPRWSKNSIKRHLVFSPECKGLFDDVMKQILKTVIYNLDGKIFHPDKSVHKENHKMLLSTMEEYMRVERFSERFMTSSSRKRRKFE